MAKISMRNIQKSSVSEYFDLYLSSAAARGVKDKTLQTYKQHFHAIAKRMDVTVPMNRLGKFQFVEQFDRSGSNPAPFLYVFARAHLYKHKKGQEKVVSLYIHVPEGAIFLLLSGPSVHAIIDLEDQTLCRRHYHEHHTDLL